MLFTSKFAVRMKSVKILNVNILARKTFRNYRKIHFYSLYYFDLARLHIVAVQVFFLLKR